jgi:hypothetical protein
VTRITKHLTHGCRDTIWETTVLCIAKNDATCAFGTHNMVFQNMKPGERVTGCSRARGRGGTGDRDTVAGWQPFDRPFSLLTTLRKKGPETHASQPVPNCPCFIKDLLALKVSPSRSIRKNFHTDPRAVSKLAFPTSARSTSLPSARGKTSHIVSVPVYSGTWASVTGILPF